MRRVVAASLLLVASACSRKGASLVPEESDMTRPASEWLAMEPVRLLRDYVRIETTAQRGEREGASFLQRLLECDGIETELVCPLPKRCSLLARLAGRRRGGALLLLNHIDVVPAYPALWKEAAPFEGRIDKGYLWGRGSYDMKSLGLAQLLALRSLKRRGIVPASDILFLAEADEETGQKLGAAWLLDHRAGWFAGVANVLNEGGDDEMILRTVRFWGIETLQAGYGLLEVESREPERIRELQASYPKLVALPVVAHPHVVAGFAMLANHLGHPLTDPLRHLDRVRANPAELAILPDRYGSFLEPRIAWFGPYAFPPGSKDQFRGYVVVSAPPGLPPERYLRPLREETLRHGLSIVSSFDSGPTGASPYPTAFTEVLRRVTEAWFPGIPFGPVPTFGGATTSIVFRRRGVPAYGYSPIPMNIGDAARRHGNDERLYLRDYVNGVDLYGDLLEEIALGPGADLSPAGSRN